MMKRIKLTNFSTSYS